MSQGVDVKGHCYCGAIEYAVRIPEGEAPLFSLYCHCDSCRRSHAAPLYQVVCVDEAHFELTSGSDTVTEFHKGGKAPIRAFCQSCGSRIYNRFPVWRPKGKVGVAFFPGTLDAEVQAALPELLRPTRHAFADACVLDFARLDELR